MKKFGITLIILILFGCNSNNEIPDFDSEIDYAYKATEYFEIDGKKDTLSYKYFDKNGKLTEEIGEEYRVKFTYNDKGILTEKDNCRIYNCALGWREIFIYDNNDNYIGRKIIIKKPKSEEPESEKSENFEQTKFYDSNNHLVKEFSDAGTYMDGSGKWEIWTYYSYQNNRIQTEIQKRNGELVWKGEYKYDPDGNLISINRKNDPKYEIELFQYDKDKKLIKKSIENDELLSDNTSFSAHNNSTIYKYDKLGRITQEITFNHKGQEYRRFTYKYDVKK